MSPIALPDAAKDLIRSGVLGHLVTLGSSGAPQVTCVWVGIDGDDLLTAHLNPTQRKLDNVRRDPRVAVSFEGTTMHPPGLKEYVSHMAVRRSRRAARPAAQQLAHVYLGPDVKFPPMDDPPPGVRLRISVDRLSGIGPW